MKYVATINGKKYEVEVEKLEAYKSLDRNGVAAPAAPVLPASAPVQRPAAPAPAPVAAAPAPAPGHRQQLRLRRQHSGGRNYRRSSNAR